ncbi:MAG: MBL fold metallo-hydrolase [Terriglobia bacterium]
MLLKQYYLGCLAHASYLVGDRESGMAAVVDPQRDVDQYLADAEAEGVQIRYVFLSHFHADFVAGHLELRDRAKAQICLGSRAVADYDFFPMKENDVLPLGTLRLRILETPGHSIESISIVLYEGEENGKGPTAVLTGDTLFVGDVGRPDLRASMGYSREALGAMLYESLHGKLLQLPDETLVYPAHGAGSLCGKNLSTETFSTIGVQRQYNYALQPMSKEDFIQLVTVDQPEAPSYFTFDAILNTKEHQTLEETLEKVLTPLPLERVLELQSMGAQIVDVREASDFAASHLKGSVNIGLGGQFASWAGTILQRDTQIVLVSAPGLERESATRLGRIGFDFVAGFLKGGMEAVTDKPELLGRTLRVTATTLIEELASPHPPILIDVRTERERREKRIEPSLHLPLNQLPERVKEIPPGRNLVVHCAGGYRSSLAASLLKRSRPADVKDLLGGISAWEKSGFPVFDSGGKVSTSLKPKDYSEKMIELEGWKVRLTSYGLGDRYYCKADDVEPGACITRSEAGTLAEAEQTAIGKVREYFSRASRLEA